MKGTKVRNKMKKLIKLLKNKVHQVENKIGKFINRQTRRRKYMCQVLLAVPLLFIVHQWLLVSPYSEHRILGFILFILRYAVPILLLTSWVFNTGVSLLSNAAIMCDIIMLWLQQINYWTFQEVAYEMCMEKNTFVWSDVLSSWRLLAAVTLLFETFYFLWFRMKILVSHRFKKTLTFLYRALAILTVFLDVACVFGMLPGWFSELSYWVKSLTFSAVILRKSYLLFNTAISPYDEINFQLENVINRLPGKWFIRDTYFAFGIIYVWCMFLFEVFVTGRSLLSFTTLHTVLEILAAWCTSSVILLALLSFFLIMSNFGVAFCCFFFSTEFTMLEIFNADIGNIVQIFSLTTLLETDILSQKNGEKTDALVIVCFFSFNVIVYQISNVLSEKVLHAVNSGASPGLYFHFKVAILTGLLVMGPSLATYHLARNLSVDPWIFFFASRNSILIINMLFLVVESSFVMLKWHAARHIDTLENVDHYFRFSKSIITIVVEFLQLYYKLICGLFKSSWLLRIPLAVIYFLRVIHAFYIIEQNRFIARYNLMLLMNSLVDVSFKMRMSRKTPNENDHQTKEHWQNESAEEDREQDTHDCTICYSKIVEGKMFPCGHAFHKECIKRWLGIKLSCPFCNTAIFK